MRHFAVVGSGPAGFYTAEALEKAYGDAGADRHPRPLSGALRPDPLRRRARPPVAEGGQQALRQGRRKRRGRLHRQRHRRPRRLGRRAARALRRGDPRDRRSARPQARHSRRGSARRRRLGRVRRLVQRPSRFRRPRSAARGHARGGHRQRQCRARLRAHPVEDAGRVRRLGHRRPRARRARSRRRSGRSRSSAAAARTRSP